MIIDPSELDSGEYCTIHGYWTRLDGTVEVVLHKWDKWARHSPVEMRRTCQTCGAIQSRHSVYKPRKKKAGQNVVNLDDYRAS